VELLATCCCTNWYTDGIGLLSWWDWHLPYFKLFVLLITDVPSKFIFFSQFEDDTCIVIMFGCRKNRRERFFEVDKHLWSLQAINVFVSYILYSMKS
jgi:hypothetical protein